MIEIWIRFGFFFCSQYIAWTLPLFVERLYIASAERSQSVFLQRVFTILVHSTVVKRSLLWSGKVYTKHMMPWMIVQFYICMLLNQSCQIPFTEEIIIFQSYLKKIEILLKFRCLVIANKFLEGFTCRIFRSVKKQPEVYEKVRWYSINEFARYSR